MFLVFEKSTPKSSFPSPFSLHVLLYNIYVFFLYYSYLSLSSSLLPLFPCCCHCLVFSFSNLGHGFLCLGIEECSCSCSCQWVAAFQLHLGVWNRCPTSTWTRRYVMWKCFLLQFLPLNSQQYKLTLSIFRSFC